MPDRLAVLYARTGGEAAVNHLHHRLVIFTLEHRGVIGQFQPISNLYGTLGAKIELVEVLIAKLIDTVLSIITPTDGIANLL